tara:strand:+ start:86 stop:571 length:486 start_codon:yes stop_codon:yes gene_type:complete
MKFTHINNNKHPNMVDVSEKVSSERSAVAECIVNLNKDTLESFQDAGWESKKGPILDTAIIAGTMAAKKTSELIPFCHPLKLQSVKIDISPTNNGQLRIEARVKAFEQTGVEMEALSAVSIAALTIYDMCKSVAKDIFIESTRLLEKRGGKSDYTLNDNKE